MASHDAILVGGGSITGLDLIVPDCFAQYAMREGAGLALTNYENGSWFRRIAAMEVLYKVRDIFLDGIGRFSYRLIITLPTDNILNTRFTTSSPAISNGIYDLLNVLFIQSFYYNG